MNIVKRIFDGISWRLKKLWELSLYLPDLLSPKGHLWVMYGIPYRIKDNYNWGDDVNKYLMEQISGKKIIPYQCSIFQRVHYLCIGSLLQWNGDKDGIVWGSGLREALPVRPCKQFLAVRGPLTRNELLKQGYDCPEVYGDPALLFPRYYQPKVSKQYKVGIIAHFSELESQAFREVEGRFDIHFIDIKHYGRYTNFIDEIYKCQYVLSSSLHGCIISDAYEVPNLWCKFTDYVAEGDGFKFRDYYASVGKDITHPTLVETVTDIEHSIAIINKTWIKNNIDLEKLLDVCPFKK